VERTRPYSSASKRVLGGRVDTDTFEVAVINGDEHRRRRCRRVLSVCRSRFESASRAIDAQSFGGYPDHVACLSSGPFPAHHGVQLRQCGNSVPLVVRVEARGARVDIPVVGEEIFAEPGWQLREVLASQAL
jgi:hypothetical protein